MIYNKLADLMTRWDVESGKCAGRSLYSRHMPDAGYLVHALLPEVRLILQTAVHCIENEVSLL